MRPGIGSRAFARAIGSPFSDAAKIAMMEGE
jgi:hypothetical protein